MLEVSDLYTFQNGQSLESRTKFALDASKLESTEKSSMQCPEDRIREFIAVGVLRGSMQGASEIHSCCDFGQRWFQASKIRVTGVFNSFEQFERNWLPWCLKKGVCPVFAVCFCVDRTCFFGGCPWSSLTSVRRRQDPVLRGSSWRWENIHRQVYCRGLSSILG